MTTRVRDRAPLETWFVSDVHIRYGDAPYLAQFIAFLERARGRAERLYIVGDLFEFWIGSRQASLAFYRPLFEALAALVGAGTSVAMVKGNRDFLIGKPFVKAGAEMLADSVLLEFGGRRLHLSHGDQFCIHDRSYQAARRVFRSRLAWLIAESLPVGVGLWLARRYRRISSGKMNRLEKRGYSDRFHTIEDGVKRELEVGGHDVLICGHIHLMQDVLVEVQGRKRRVITTGAWEEGPNYVAWTGTDFALRRFDPGRD